MSIQELERAVEAGDVVHALKEYGVTQADVAKASGAEAKTVYAWRASKSRPRNTTYQRLDGLRETVRILSDSLTQRGVGQWLHAPNRLLDGRLPLDVLRDGDQPAVLAAAQAFIDGAYV